LRFLKQVDDHWVFRLGTGEKLLLCHLLNLYPQIPPGRQPLSKSRAVPEPAASQQMLDEALAESRGENKKRVEVFLADKHRFARRKNGWWFRLNAAEIEWLLCVLNDIRVGSWVSLGSPERLLNDLNEETAPRYAAMELAGSFQVCLLEAVGEG
jgi:hypothetical protein